MFDIFLNENLTGILTSRIVIYHNKENTNIYEHKLHRVEFKSWEISIAKNETLMDNALYADNALFKYRHCILS
jgi:hypothetical protein